jgi:hypothetical protein
MYDAEPDRVMVVAVDVDVDVDVVASCPALDPEHVLAAAAEHTAHQKGNTPQLD